MKKWFLVLFFSVVSVAVFAQVDPHSGSVGNQQKSSANAVKKLSSVADMFDDQKVHGVLDVDHEVMRKAAKAQAKPQTQKTQQPQTSWPHDDGIQDMQEVPPSNRPSYYAEEEAYNNCNSVDVCRSWVAEQAQKEVHFLVLSATVSTTEDLHHSKLVLKYVTYQEPQEKTFEEDFSGWKEK